MPKGGGQMLFVGHDWSEAHHDVCLMDETGGVLARTRLVEGVGGLAGFHDLVSEHASDPSQVVVGTETDQGLWVGGLVAAGYRVFAVNPKSVSRYRDRHSVSGAKSDPGDAKLLADLVRTDRHNHREIAGDSDLAAEVKVLARAHQNLIWDRRRAANRLRSTLRDYYPQALETFDDLCHPDAVSVLAKAPAPDRGAGLTASQIRSALKAGGRQRYLDQTTEKIRTGLRTEGLQARAGVEAALTTVTVSLVAVIGELNNQIQELEKRIESSFNQHPDAAIYLSMPGVGQVLGARMLGEFGDDPNRYADAKARRNYTATSPVTITSGKSRGVVARWVKNNRLSDSAIQWADHARRTSPGANALYQEQRAKGARHNQALRALANRLIGILHGCLKTHTRYDEHTAWAHRYDQATAA